MQKKMHSMKSFKRIDLLALTVNASLELLAKNVHSGVEKQELGDGWVLSCHGSDRGGLTLTDVTIQ